MRVPEVPSPSYILNDSSDPKDFVVLIIVTSIVDGGSVETRTGDGLSAITRAIRNNR